MRQAVITDIHGNIDALDAVLERIGGGSSVDGILVLGDIASGGPDPCEVIERLQGLDGMVCISGNADRFVTRGVTLSWFGGRVTDENVHSVMRANWACGWTQAILMNGGKLEWLEKLPPRHEIVLPDGRGVLAVHGSPQSDEKGFSEEVPDEEQRAMLEGCSADLIVAGHTHVEYHRGLGPTEVHVIPSVSLPVGADKSAGFAILDLAGERIEVTVERVDYDYAAVVERARRQRHPGLGRIEYLFS